MKLLSINADAKTTKGQSKGYLTGIMYLAPHKIAGRGNVCPWSTKGCRVACLYTAGRGRMSSVQTARIARTDLFYDNRKAFKQQLITEITAFERKARRLNLKPAVRLNGTSDLSWERLLPDLFEMFAHIQFYDYTKSEARVMHWAAGNLPENYHLTLSASEIMTDHTMGDVIDLGATVAVVFSGELPRRYRGAVVIDGDKHDLRFLDAPGVIVGLRAKGDAKLDDSGFVRHAA